MQDKITNVRRFYTQHGKMPSVREFSSLIGTRSIKMTYKAIEEMIEEELIFRDGKGKLQPYKIIQTPFVGSIRAGIPQTLEEYREWVDLRKMIIQKPDKTIAIKVEGDSMKDAGILDGDIVLAELGAPYKEDSIVAAKVDGEYTLKYLKYRNNKPYLAPANVNYAVIIPRESLEIPAVVTGVYRGVI